MYQNFARFAFTKLHSLRGMPVCFNRYYRLLSKPNGDGEIRTHDPLLARQVLSQLSYTPILIWQPPTLPCRLQHSTIGRLSLNRRVRDENGCVP